MRKWFAFLFLAGSLFHGCKSNSNLSDSSEIPQVFLDTFLVPLSPPPYQPSATRAWDLIHMNLELEPIWSQSEVAASAELILSPYFYDSDSLEIDAKGYLIQSLKVVNDTQNILLSYAYNGNKLSVKLNKPLSADDSLSLFLKYIARPDSMNDNASGRAIASEKGMFFINPDGMKTSKPRQLWTQGETENNSRWFPCIDKPNERFTHQISVRIEESLSSLSNGELIFSTLNGDGTRTDVWEMNQAHAPYLVMLAVGDFLKVEDTQSPIPINYWLEPDYSEDALSIFGKTPEMMTFFDSITGVKYPWGKYDQIIVRDYISGAMENTGAVVLGEFLYHKKLEFLDTDEEDIIAHELFHHWFGNLVTCESWANLTLNEGFASYGEYLWREYSRGPDWAQSLLLDFKQNYLEESNFGTKNLIRYHYRDENELFDRHSYDKGALILHMLRSYLGDKAFFAGIRKYLTANAYQSVEVHDLRLAFEAVSGKDLNWFFNQWFLGKGHPDLEIAYAVKEKTAQVMIVQKQDQDKFDLFEMPVELLVKSSKGEKLHTFTIRDEVSIFEVPIDSGFQYLSLDPNETLLAEKSENKSVNWLMKELAFSGNIEKKWRNWIQLLDRSYDESVPLNTALSHILEHPSQHLRKLCLEWLDRDIAMAYNLIPQLRQAALKDSSSIVRNQALLQLLNLSYSEKQIDFVVACTDSSILVSSSALGALSKFALNEALHQSSSFENSPYDKHLLAVAEVYAQEGGGERVDFYKKAYEQLNAFRSPQLIGLFSDYLLKTPSISSKVAGLSVIQDYLLNQTVWWQKIVGIDALNALKIQQENIIRKLSKAASDDESNQEIKAEVIEQIMNADLVLENIQAVREAVLSTETNPKIKELMR